MTPHDDPGIVCNDNGTTYLLLYSDWDYLRSIGAFDERLYLLSFGQEYLIRRYREGRLSPAEIVRLHDEQYLLWRLGLESEDYQRVIKDATFEVKAMTDEELSLLPDNALVFDRERNEFAVVQCIEDDDSLSDWLPLRYETGEEAEMPFCQAMKRIVRVSTR